MILHSAFQRVHLTSFYSMTGLNTEMDCAHQEHKYTIQLCYIP